MRNTNGLLRGIVLLLLVRATVPAQSPLSNSLPVKRVVLYKNGVGYFEHEGKIQGNQDVKISFTSGQLNDVLKSLTVLDLGGGRVTNVRYGTSQPADRRLGDLRLPVSEKTSLAELLGALRGARLEVKSGATVITGRLLSIERKTRISGGTTLEVDYVSLLTDSGDLRTTELSPAFSVRLLEQDLSGKVSRYLDVLSTAREADLREMTVSTSGSGERPLFVSYISEVPVWKTTYRIILPSKAGQDATLQGWAIVDNTVGEDWRNVQLSLVAGAPHSFIQNLSQPFYSRRPEVALPETASVAPQTFEGTLRLGSARVAGVVLDQAGSVIVGARISVLDSAGSVVAQTVTGANGRYELGGLPDGAGQVQIYAPGFQMSRVGVQLAAGLQATASATLAVGSTSETVNVTAESYPLQASTSRLASAPRNLGSGRALGGGAGAGAGVGRGSGGGIGGGSYRVDEARAALEAASRGQDLGDLFEYKLKEPITILKNQSALVPVIQSGIKTEKVSVWNESSNLRKPQRALWLTNSSALTLDSGSFSVLESEAFAGEGIMEPVKPGERRLISYATDLALTPGSRRDVAAQRVTRVRINRGVMVQESEVREKKTYTMRNEDQSARTVIIEHPFRPNLALRSEPKPVETTAAWQRFRLLVEPKQTATLVVEESRPQEVSYTLSQLREEQIAVFVKEGAANPEVEGGLRKIISQKATIAQLEEKKEGREKETQSIFDDQQRLRENLKALKGSAEEKALAQRYLQQLSEQESRLDALKKEVESLDRQVEAANAELERLTNGLTMDVRLN